MWLKIVIFLLKGSPLAEDVFSNAILLTTHGKIIGLKKRRQIVVILKQFEKRKQVRPSAVFEKKVKASTKTSLWKEVIVCEN